MQLNKGKHWKTYYANLGTGETKWCASAKVEQIHIGWHEIKSIDCLSGVCVFFSIRKIQHTADDMRVFACFALFVKTCEMSMLCKTAESVYGRFLKQHVISTHSASEPLDCTLVCQKVGKCRSWNFWLDEKKCELNDGDNYNHPRDLKEKDRVIYSNAIVSAPNAVSAGPVSSNSSVLTDRNGLCFI